MAAARATFVYVRRLDPCTPEETVLLRDLQVALRQRDEVFRRVVMIVHVYGDDSPESRAIQPYRDVSERLVDRCKRALFNHLLGKRCDS